MNRRSSFRTAAALSTVAALHSAGQTSPSTLPVRAATPTGNPPREVNIADAGYAAGIADLGAEFFVPLEELYPCDPGELSGAKLFLCDGGKGTFVSAGIGDTLQPFGYRSSHWLGHLHDDDTARLAATDLAFAPGGFTAIFKGPTSPVR